eukprot:5473871-Prorocentrum_lima.AAC.1
MKGCIKHYLKAQDLILKDNIRQSNQGATQGWNNSNTGPVKANLVQPVEGNMDWDKMARGQLVAAL